MSNPIIAKPTYPVFYSGGTLGSGISFIVPFTEGYGVPYEITKNVAPWLSHGSINNAPTGKAGPPPAWKSNGFTVNSTNYGPSIRADYGTVGYVWPAVGWTSITNGTSKTLVAIVKTDTITFNRSNGAVSWNMFGIEEVGSNGLCFTSDLTGDSTGDSCCSDINRVEITCSNSYFNSPATFQLIKDHWYAIALVISNSAGTYNWTIYMYDFNTQKMHPANGTVVSIGGYYGAYGNVAWNVWNTNSENCFIGEIAALAGYNLGFAASDFANYVTNPWSCWSGIYVPSASGLSIGYGQNFSRTMTSTSLVFPIPTGSGVGTGSTGLWQTAGFNAASGTTMQVWRAATPLIPPGSGGSVQLPSGSLINTGTTVYVNDTDTALATNNGYWYTLKGIDGTSGVLSSPVYSFTSAKSSVTVMVLGDSVYQFTGIPEYCEQCAIGDNRNFLLLGRARGGGTISTGYSNRSASFASDAIYASGNQTVQISLNNTPASGKFELDFNVSTTLVAVSGISYNVPASSLATSINAALNTSYSTSGINYVVCTGGPFPGTAINIAGNAGAYANSAFDLPAFNVGASTLAGGSGTSYVYTAQTFSSSPGDGSNTLFRTSLSEGLRVGATWATISFSANDAPANSSWQTNLQNLVSSLWASGIKSLILYGVVRHPGGTVNTFLDPVSDATYWDFFPYINAVGAANPGVAYIGPIASYSVDQSLMDSQTVGDGVHPTNVGPVAGALGYVMYKNIAKAIDGPDGLLFVGGME